MKVVRQIMCLLFLALLFGCKEKSQRIRPTVGAISESIYASGILKSENQYEVYSSVSGIADSIYVTEGDEILKGMPILSITNTVQRLNEENAQLTATYSDIRSNIDKLKEAELQTFVSLNKLKNDSLMYFRQKNLWRQQIGSKAEFEQRELAYQNSKSDYFSAQVRYTDLKRLLELNAAQSKKNLAISGKLADDYLLKSKVDGTVLSVDKKQGEIITVQSPVAVIGNAKKFILEMQVDEYDIIKVHKNMLVLVTLDSYGSAVFEATVSKINPLMNPRSRTFLVEAKFIRPPAKLYPNISFEANIVLASKDKALLVPRNYVIGDSIVYRSDGKTVSVRTGLKDYRKIEIISGINAQDELIPPSP